MLGRPNGQFRLSPTLDYMALNSRIHLDKKMSLLIIFSGCSHPSERTEKISTIVGQNTFLLITMLSGTVLSTTQVKSHTYK